MDIDILICIFNGSFNPLGEIWGEKIIAKFLFGDFDILKRLFAFGYFMETPTKDFTKIIIPKSMSKPERCEVCAKPLPKRHVVHKNISQSEPVHKFCSRVCKEKWCYDQSCE
ncbi:MAG: hypothetical protein ACTSRK_01495 [Promethearchaeota archaeon]